jgi:dihydropteroate synthase
MMGVINLTPDSFSGDGIAGDDLVARALTQAETMIRDGAAMLDIGGESSRPGAAPVSAEEEMRRTIPVIIAIRAKFPETVIAIDTIKAVVADAALEAGATIVNDISALAADENMAALVSRRGARVVLMHNSSRPGDVTHDPRLGSQFEADEGGDIVAKVTRELMQRVDIARQAGVSADKIILDPGLGFGKTVAQNLALINHVDRFKDLGFPVLMGPSRKSFIGRVLDLPIDSRLEGTAAAVAICTLRGADIIRVHDVQFMARVARMTAAIAEAGLLS